MVARTAWEGTINATAPKYLKGAADLTIRNRLILAMLRRKGRIKLNESGDQCNWDVEFKEPPITAHSDGANVDFTRHDLLKQLAIDWRGYKGTDMMTRHEKEMNKGDVVIVNRYRRIIPALTKALKNTFGAEMYIDGYTSGNENRLHGLESFAGDGTTVAADLVAQPSDTYGGLSTALANQGGTWTTDRSTSPNAAVATDWPYGNGQSQYDYLTPKLVNISSTNWGTGSTTWADNCQRVLRFTTTALKNTCGPDGKPTMYITDAEMLDDVKNKIEAKQRIIIPHRTAQDLGFEDVLSQDGVAIDDDFDCPNGTGYGINVEQMELACLTDELWYHDGPEWSIDAQAYKFLIGFMGNIRYQPKYQAKFKAYA